MKIAYIIHAYKLPDQLARFINSLASPNEYFFIHIDKKVDILPFKEAFKKVQSKNIIWVTREYSNWGTISCVKAVLNGLFEALAYKEKIEYFYCLSGQDYPIKSKNYIEKFFLQNKEKNFLVNFPLPYNGWKGGGIHRFNRYHFIISKNRYIRKFVNIINFFLPRRDLPLNFKPYGGEFYFGINRETLIYLKSFLEKNPDYINFFKYTYIPEEIFFQTIILNAPEKISSNVVNKTLTFVDWNKPHGPYPAILKTEDFDNINNSEKLFARKFDYKIDNNILDLIDKKIL